MDKDIRDFSPFLDRLESVYAEMDRKYDETAEHYGFRCDGCEDNCCMSLFFHHTFLEYFHLQSGLSVLSEIERTEAEKRAEAVCAKDGEFEGGEERIRVMCPLNIDGRCILYDCRPMICRLHGIPYELRMPGGRMAHGPGCDAFAVQASGKNDFRLDRTPFYAKMSALEMEFKQHLGVSKKLKMTVARMIVADTADVLR